MGSGLILLAIVGAWLAVLVPMALRRHDASSLGTVDKFHDAMRVLSRRDSGARAAADEPDEDAAHDEPEPGRIRAGSAWLSARVAARRKRRPATPAARRRRLLLLLVVLSVASLVGAVVGPLWLLAPHLQVDLLLGAFLVHLRRTAVARAEREWRTAMSERPAPRRVVREAEPPAAAPVLRAPVHVAGVPDRMPSRQDVGTSVPVVAPAVLPAARGAQGAAWSPVPVPAPTYLSAPVAPRPVVDLTRAGAADGGLTDAERDLGIVDSGPELDEILERRRAVNDW